MQWNFGRAVLAAGVAAAALVVTTPMAAAREPSIWAQCDGQPKPEGAGVTAARMATVILGSGFLIGLLALPEAPTSADLAVGQAGVDACTAALQDPIIETFWPRKINVLRARALAYVQIEKYDLALADLTAARAVGEGKPAQILFDRSVGVSVLLFEAALRARAGETEKARELAMRAADARPYVSRIQIVARLFFADTPALTPEEARLIDRIASQAGRPVFARAARLSATDDAAGAAAAWERALTDGIKTQQLVNGAGDLIELLETDDPSIVARAAVAVARAGDVERAKVLRDRLQKSLAAAPATPAQTQAEGRTRAELLDARIAQFRMEAMTRVRATAEPYIPLLDALILQKSGDAAGALAIVQRDFAKLPRERATVDLLDALAADPAIGAQVPAFLVQSVRAESAKSVQEAFQKADLLGFVRQLPQFQRVDGRNRYRTQGPPGFRNGVGYLSEARSDGVAGATIEYGGAPGLDIRDEMLLLRAAELTIENKQGAFKLTQRLEGKITIAYVPAGGENTLDAAQVIAALKPVYIDIPAEIDADRRKK